MNTDNGTYYTRNGHQCNRHALSSDRDKEIVNSTPASLARVMTGKADGRSAAAVCNTPRPVRFGPPSEASGTRPYNVRQPVLPDINGGQMLIACQRQQRRQKPITMMAHGIE